MLKNSTMKKNNSLITGNVFTSLIFFTLPIFFALILQVMYSTVDMLIVSNFGEISDISGVSTGSQLMNLIVSLCTGLATGSTILIGHFIGEKQNTKVSIVMGNSITVFFIFGLILTIVLLFGNKFIIHVLNTPKEAILSTSEYIFYCTLGIPMIFMYNIFSSIFRGVGNATLALVTVGIACFVNILLDLVFVAGFEMGAKGAAIATALAQTSSVLISIIIIKKKKLFSIKKSDFYIKAEYLARILQLGIPIAIQSVLVSFSFLAITVIVNQFGVVYSASVGVVEKLTGLIMLVPLSFMQSMSVFTAQNYGAKEFSRTKKGLVIGTITALAPSIIMAYLGFFHGNVLLSLFTSDKDVIANAIGYLQSYSIDTLQVPFLFCITGFFSGYGKSLFVMLQGVLSALGIRLVLTYLFSFVTPTSLFLIGLSTPISTFIQLLVCFIYYFYLDKKGTFKIVQNNSL